MSLLFLGEQRGWSYALIVSLYRSDRICIATKGVYSTGEGGGLETAVMEFSLDRIGLVSDQEV